MCSTGTLISIPPPKFSCYHIDELCSLHFELLMHNGGYAGEGIKKLAKTVHSQASEPLIDRRKLANGLTIAYRGV